MCKKILWPESQQCVGCKFGNLCITEDALTYICEKGLKTPTDVCREPSVKNLGDLENEDLIEIRDEFYEKHQNRLSFNLNDFETLIIEIEKRTQA